MSDKVKTVGANYSVAGEKDRDTLECWLRVADEKYIAYQDKYGTKPTAFMYASNAPSTFGEKVAKRYKLKLERINLQPYVFRFSNGSGDTIDFDWFVSRGELPYDEAPVEQTDEEPVIFADEEEYAEWVAEYGERHSNVLFDDSLSKAATTKEPQPQPNKTELFNYHEDTQTLHIFVTKDHPTIPSGHYKIDHFEEEMVAELDSIENDEQANSFIEGLFQIYDVTERIYTP